VDGWLKGYPSTFVFSAVDGNERATGKSSEPADRNIGATGGFVDAQLKRRSGVCSFAIMNRMGTIFLSALSLVALDAVAIEARTSPYDKIAERNLFQLHAPAVVAEAGPKPPPLRKITLTGIATTFGKAVAFITIEGIRAQPAESLMLMSGQMVNGIEVREIDERAGVVRILNGEELQILNFEAPKSTDMPSPNLPASPPGVSSVPARAEAAMTPEEQTALIELQRLKFQHEGNPIHALLPPTELTSNDKETATP
jgi:hypothetical protein